MTVFWKRFLSCLLVLINFHAMSCKTTATSQALSSGEAAANHPDVRHTQDFRNIFYSYVKDKYALADFQKLIYLPTPEILNLKVPATDSGKVIDSFGKDFTLFRPSELYAYGAQTPVEAIADPDAAFQKSGPITIVVIPGIFGEFIATYPYYDFVNGSSSSLSRRFQNALKAPGNAENKTTASFDFASFKTIQKPLGDWVKVASFDDAAGQPLLNLIVLPSEAFSAETLGTLDSSTAIYLERLGKYFALMGTDQNIYIMGYSRGGPVALDVLVQADKQKLPWAQNLKGTISLAGVLYGAALADAALDANDPASKLVARVAKLTQELEDGSDEKKSEFAAVAARNATRWSAAAQECLALFLATPQPEGLTMEAIPTETPNIDLSVAKLHEIAFQKFNLADPSEANYFTNVKKFKFIIGRVLEGIVSLSTEARIAWWKSNILPTRMKYFAISGAMGDISDKEHGVWALTGNPIAYRKASQDYRLLRGNFYELHRVAGAQISDGQVSIDRARYLFDLTQKLNPAQPPFESYYLGTLGVDHWGLSFPYGLPSQTLASSPFPRTQLIHAIGAFVAQKTP